MVGLGNLRQPEALRHRIKMDPNLNLQLSCPTSTFPGFPRVMTLPAGRTRRFSETRLGSSLVGPGGARNLTTFLVELGQDVF